MSTDLHDLFAETQRDEDGGWTVGFTVSYEPMLDLWMIGTACESLLAVVAAEDVEAVVELLLDKFDIFGLSSPEGECAEVAA